MRIAIRLVAVCACLAMGSPAWAQNRAGVMLGVNFAKLHFTGPDVVQPDNRTGFAGGAFVTMMGESVGLEMDALYSQKGAKLSEAGETVTIALDYLDIPVLARFSGTGSGTKLAIVAGPSFGFKLRAQTKEEIGGQTHTVDISSDVSSFDFGFVVGAGVDAGKLLLDGRYQWGLSNANKTEFAPDEKVKSRVFSILLGIRL